MMFSGNHLCDGARRSWRAVALVALGMLASCGGGTSQQVVFKPDRVIALGDEASVITAAGKKYSVNALDANDALSCADQPLWTQIVASSYGYVFEACNPGGTGTVQAYTRATVGARIDDLSAQIDAQIASGGFTSKDLVTVLVGVNDLLALYRQYPQRDEAALTADARAAGDRLAALVNRIVGLGPRVIISTAPDIGLSPYALAQKAANTDTDRAALISRLVAALNARMRVGIVNDGRLLGLVLADEAVQVMVRVPDAFALVDVTGAACTVALPDCTTKTLLSTVTAATALWADDLQLGVPYHSRVGLLAQQRALNNPF